MSHQAIKSTGLLILGLILLCITTSCVEAGGNELATNQKSLPSVQTKNSKGLSASKTEQYSTTPSVRSTSGGNLIWAKNAGQASGFGITTLSDDSTVVTGCFERSATFGPGQMDQVTLTSDGIGFDSFIARYNPDGKLEWVKHNTGTGGEIANGITTLSDNSSVITGFFEDTATFGKGEPNETVLTCAGIRDFFIARFDPDGTLVWAKQAGAESNAAGSAITSLSDNSVVVTGWFGYTAVFGPGEPNQTQLDGAGYRDMFVARYNHDGTLSWAKRAGGTFPDEGHGITSLSNDSIVVTGHFISTPTFGMEESNQTVLTSTGESDMFIARYNPDGTLAWVKHAGGLKWDESMGITSLSDDSTVVTGCFEDSAVFGNHEISQTTLKSTGKSDIFVARYSPDGSLAWAKQAGGSRHYDYGVGITTLSDDSMVVTGYFYSQATFGRNETNKTILKSAGMNDIFVAKYNPEGTLIWAKCAVGRDSDIGHGITTLSDNSTVVVGEIKGSAIFGRGEINETEIFSAKISDMFLARFAP